MSYQQLHVGKVKLNGLGGIRHHLLDRERVKTNPNIDLTRSHLNHSIEELSPEHLERNVRQRIKQLHLKRKPRSDAVGLADIIVGASSDFMLQLGTEKREQYFANALYFFQRRYGKENVMYCYCHLDEYNPHVHIGVIPVTKDGRLSARDLFNPKSLEKLQTDFHQQVSRLYGLERGEHHARNYLELNQFKAQQAKQELQQYTEDLNTLLLTQNNIGKINKSVHFVSTGVLFKSEDREHVELATQDFITLRQMAEEGIKAVAFIRILQEQLQLAQYEKDLAKSDLDSLQHKFDELNKLTTNYAAIPPAWRKRIDLEILKLQRTFTAYCHDLHRAAVRVFIATHGDFQQTVNIMHDIANNVGIKDVEKLVTNVNYFSQLQFKKNIQPTIPPPSWKPPEPSETDYTKPDETDIVPLQLSRVPDINWDMINWDLLSQPEREEIHEKIEMARWL